MTHLANLYAMHARGEKIAMLTCYDASFATLCNAAKVDILLVGDSLGNVIQGQAYTTSVHLADMVYHTRMVARGNTHSLIMADMPFGSYGDAAMAYQTAVALIQAGAAMVKLEGGAHLAPIIAHLTQHGIPVCAHIGLMPQFVHQKGLRMQGKDAQQAQQILHDAISLEDAGAAMVLLECVPAALAEQVTLKLVVPTIGIGAGLKTSGQVLVLYDVLGISPTMPPFAKNFLNEQNPSILSALQAYVAWVKT